ncbi:hypothetical protein CRUP_008711 [Coryphaenoides rupestris]|nr:hypothetical protein CRUP_008711 [Coryphaenoides rupestris]
MGGPTSGPAHRAATTHGYTGPETRPRSPERRDGFLAPVQPTDRRRHEPHGFHFLYFCMFSLARRIPRRPLYSSSVSGAIEACMGHMLKRRAAGFLRSDKIAALFTKIGKVHDTTGDVCCKVQEQLQQQSDISRCQ